MTCEQFLTMNQNDATFFALTTAERAACFQHYRGCPKCRLHGGLQLLNVNDEEKKRQALELLAKDRQDPEWYE